MTGAVTAVDRSTLRLSEVARHVIVPSGIERTLWLGWDGQPGAEERVREFGYEFDRWQDGLAQVALGVTAAGHFAATVGGVIMSIPRQVAKTFMTMVIVLALCSMFPNLTALWTAHRSRLSTQTFRKMKALARSKAMRKYILPGPEGVRSTNGEQEIRFRNGSVIMFGAREHGFGLGFDEVDIEVFDEAQRLTSNALDDMVAATNQSRWMFGALLFFMGTPPRPTDEGEEFTNRRAKALRVKESSGLGDFEGVAVGGEAVYVECSADKDTGMPGGPDINDRDQVRIANPSYPTRTPEISVQRLREQLTQDDSWRREGLGIWDDVAAAKKAISFSEWSVLTGVKPDSGRLAFGVKFTPDGSTVALAGGVRPDEGPVHVEGLRQENLASGLGWLVDFLAKRADETSLIVIDGKSGAGALVAALRDEGLTRRGLLLIPTLDQVVSAHAMFLEAIKSGGLTHLGQGPLDEQVKDAVRRPIGKSGSFGWDPDKGETVVLLDAVTYAFWGAKVARTDPGAGRSDASRRRMANTGRRGR